MIAVMHTNRFNSKKSLFIITVFITTGSLSVCQASTSAVESDYEDEVEIIEVDEDFRHYLVIVLDGLRPDYITPELMPILHELGQNGVVAENYKMILYKARVGEYSYFQKAEMIR